MQRIEEIEYLSGEETLRAQALRYREVAAVPVQGYWWLIHVPSGCSINGLCWGDQAAAEAGLIKVDSVSNRWLELDEEDRARIQETFLAGDFGFAPVMVVGGPGNYEEKANGYG